MQFDTNEVISCGAGMGGSWAQRKPDAPDQRNDLYAWVRESDGARFVYHDTRMFGFAKLVPFGTWDQGLGIDFTESRLLDYQTELRDAFARFKRKPVKVALLDQSVIAGIGNVYASEILWHLRVHPSLPMQEFGRYRALGIATHRILCKAIKGKGVRSGRTTMKYEARPVTKGGYVVECYDQEGNPCRRCDTQIEKIEIGGRSSYFCPTCQPEP